MLLDKRVILCGDKKIRNDFEYLFDMVYVEGYLIDTKQNKELFDKKILEIDKVTSKELCDVLIVICDKKENNYWEDKLKQLNLVKSKDYIYVEEVFKYYNPIYLERKGRKLVVWGTGKAAHDLCEKIINKKMNLDIAYFIDNKKDKKEFYGKIVKSPDQVEEWNDVYIIVATYDFHWEIYKQLHKYGLTYQKDYVHSTTVFEDLSDKLSKTFFTLPKYSFKCHRPYGTCDVIGEDVFLCCPDFLPFSAGSMKYKPFYNCWHSYMAKLLRLSIQNGTYVFCNTRYCDLHNFDLEKGNEVNNNNCSQEVFNYPKSLMLGIDQTCNLQCPSCRKKVYVANDNEKKEMYRQMEDFLDNIIPYVDSLWLAGNGEVFFSDIYRQILQDNRCRRRDSINILSNGTLFDQKGWKLLDGIYENINVTISLDGIKDDTIEKLRKGANAKKLKNNLAFLGDLREKGKIQKLIVNCVLQADNISEAWELLNYCQTNYVDRVQFLRLNDHNTYIDGEDFNEKSIFTNNNDVKEKYKKYFTKELLYHPIVDWFNLSKVFKLEEKERIGKYDLI